MGDSDFYGDDTAVGAGRGSTSGPPRWVKVFAIVAFVLVLLVVIVMLTGSDHGPGRHAGLGDAGGQAAPSSFTGSGDGGHTPPVGGHKR